MENLGIDRGSFNMLNERYTTLGLSVHDILCTQISLAVIVFCEAQCQSLIFPVTKNNLCLKQWRIRVSIPVSERSTT